MDTSGADVSRKLSQTLQSFSNYAGQERREIVQEESLIAGMEAGQRGELPTESEYTSASKAFNRGLRASYIAETEGDIRDNVMRIAGENELNPVGFESAALAWEKETLNGIADPRLKASIRQKIREKSSTAYLNIATQAQERANEKSLFLINKEQYQLDLDAQDMAEGGDEIGAVFFHHLDRLGIQDRTVVDGVDSGADRVLDAFGTVRVSRHLESMPLGLLDVRSQRYDHHMTRDRETQLGLSVEELSDQSP